MAQILVEVSEFMRAAQAPGLGTAHAVGLGAAPAAAPAAFPPKYPYFPDLVFNDCLFQVQHRLDYLDVISVTGIGSE